MSLDLLSLPALAGWVALAIVIDLIVGDPRALPHPVVILGKAISALEHRWNHGSPQRRRLLGGCLALVVVLGTLSVAWLGLALLSWVHPWLGLAAELWLLATTLAIKGLADAGRAIAAPLRQGDLPGARQALARVVGRDTQALDEAEITRGAVETVAENTVDGITSPLLFALLGGAPLALAYKAINTLDSMVGYRNERYGDFGYASARLDDLAGGAPWRPPGAKRPAIQAPTRVGPRRWWRICWASSWAAPTSTRGKYHTGPRWARPMIYCKPATSLPRFG